MLLFLGFGYCVLAPGPPTVPGMGTGACGMGAAIGCMPPVVESLVAYILCPGHRYFLSDAQSCHVRMLLGSFSTAELLFPLGEGC